MIVPLFLFINSEIVNVQSLLDIQALHSRQQRGKKNFSINNRVKINVCGETFETNRTTFDIYPDTLLGDEKRRKYYYDKVRQEYYFDRHRGCFEAILYYYQTHGRLRRPDHVPLDVFLEEVIFFQLGQHAIEQIRKTENIAVIKPLSFPKNSIRRYLWANTEYPDYSIVAKILHFLSIFLVVLSVIVLAIETLPEYSNFQLLYCQDQSNTNNSIYMYNGTHQVSSEELNVCYAYFASPFFIIQTICVSFFTMEFVIRILSTPSLLEYIKTLTNWIDLIAIIPFYVLLGMHLSGRIINPDIYSGLRLLRILRLLTLFKLGRVYKSAKSLRVFVITVERTLIDFILMVSIITALGFLFGASAYYFENSNNSELFDSILAGTYWGIITITGVG